GRGRARGPLADQLPADGLAVLLRRRHAESSGADCRNPHHRRNPQVRRGGYARLSEHRGPSTGGRAAAVLVLHLVLYRGLPGRVSAQRTSLSAARAEECRLAAMRRFAFAPALGALLFSLAVTGLPQTKPASEPPVSAEQLRAAIDKLGTLDYAIR